MRLIFLQAWLFCASASQDEPRTLMVWLLGVTQPPYKSPDTPAVWARRLENIKSHRENITGISPCIYSFDRAGRLVPASNVGTPEVMKHLPDYAALGLDIVPLIDAAGGIPGLAALIRNPTPFITAAVDAAVANNYSGYNFDNELRGGASDSSWRPLKDYGEPWVAFLNTFADALHAKNKTLSVDLAGCCGYVDVQHPKAPAGHCTGAFSTHEFVDTTCAMYKASRLDRVYGMSTYSGHINGPPMPDPRDNNTYNPVEIIKDIATSAKAGFGAAKYGFGFKGGWPYCVNYTDPSTCEFDSTARDTIRWIRDTLGVNHMAHWVDAPSDQAHWDAFGFFLHSK